MRLSKGVGMAPLPFVLASLREHPLSSSIFVHGTCLWLFVLVTPLGCAAGMSRRVYLDGTLACTTSSPFGGILNTSSDPVLRIGFAETYGGGNWPLTAVLDELAVFSSVLSDEQVMLLYSRGNALGNPSFETPRLNIGPSTDIPFQTPLLPNWTIPAGGGARLLLASAGSNDVRNGRQMLSFTLPSVSAALPALQQAVTGLRAGTSYMLSSFVSGDFSSLSVGEGRRGLLVYLDGKEVARVTASASTVMPVSDPKIGDAGMRGCGDAEMRDARLVLDSANAQLNEQPLNCCGVN